MNNVIPEFKVFEIDMKLSFNTQCFRLSAKLMPESDSNIIKHFESGNNMMATHGRNFSLVNNSKIPSSEVRPDLFQILSEKP